MNPTERLKMVRLLDQYLRENFGDGAGCIALYIPDGGSDGVAIIYPSQLAYHLTDDEANIYYSLLLQSRGESLYCFDVL